ncbi:hypothetical protein CFAM422_011146 [Trichoderma lentiforme]|uniref:Uncharacterized protein n=1 Tax=Trichoderma lentiforme TaxID=1567552 RepID=A0A9P4X7D3_9HYPO|nr:hypothetical protein CFAM422_011146 [Trichoderma lentiforme]
MDQHDTSLFSANSLNYSGVVAHHTVQLVRPLTAATNSGTPVGRRKICPKDDARTNRLPIASGRAVADAPFASPSLRHRDGSARSSQNLSGK